MVNPLPLGVGLLFGLLGLFAALSGLGRLRAWLRLRGSSAAGVLEPGVAEVEGTAKPLRETLTDPRGAETLAYDYAKKERRHDPDPDDPGTDWHTVETDRDSVPFLVETDGADVVVDPAGADWMLETDRRSSGGVRHESERLEVGEPAYVAGEVVTATESTVEAGQHRYVLEDGDGAFGGGLSGLAGAPFVLSDSGESEAESRLLKRGLGSLLVGVVVVSLASVFVLIGLG